MAMLALTDEEANALRTTGRATLTRPVDWDAIRRETGCTCGRLVRSVTFNEWVIVDGNGDADMCVVACPFGNERRIWVTVEEDIVFQVEYLRVSGDGREAKWIADVTLLVHDEWPRGGADSAEG